MEAWGSKRRARAAAFGPAATPPTIEIFNGSAMVMTLPLCFRIWLGPMGNAHLDVLSYLFELFKYKASAAGFKVNA
jgi:hypothetical protein